jgi:hypothetical protein
MLRIIRSISATLFLAIGILNCAAVDFSDSAAINSMVLAPNWTGSNITYNNYL